MVIEFLENKIKALEKSLFLDSDLHHHPAIPATNPQTNNNNNLHHDDSSSSSIINNHQEHISINQLIINSDEDDEDKSDDRPVDDEKPPLYNDVLHSSSNSSSFVKRSSFATQSFKINPNVPLGMPENLDFVIQNNLGNLANNNESVESEQKNRNLLKLEQQPSLTRQLINNNRANIAENGSKSLNINSGKGLANNNNISNSSNIPYITPEPSAPTASVLSSKSSSILSSPISNSNKNHNQNQNNNQNYASQIHNNLHEISSISDTTMSSSSLSHSHTGLNSGTTTHLNIHKKISSRPSDTGSQRSYEATIDHINIKSQEEIDLMDKRYKVITSILEEEERQNQIISAYISNLYQIKNSNKTSNPILPNNNDYTALESNWSKILEKENDFKQELNQFLDNFRADSQIYPIFNKRKKCLEYYEEYKKAYGEMSKVVEKMKHSWAEKDKPKKSFQIWNSSDQYLKAAELLLS